MHQRGLLVPAVALLVAALLAVSAAPEVHDPREKAGLAPRVDPPTHKSYLETIPGSRVRFEMVAVPGGVFGMGSPDTENSRHFDEGPQHPVQIHPFWMGKTEVTWDEYARFSAKWATDEKDNEAARAKDPDAVSRPTVPYADDTHGFGREGYPVVGISHHAAMEYCYWLSKQTGKAYRLPTEAEWEFACRAGTETVYFFGNDAGKLGAYAWFAGNSDESTHPVGTKKPSPWGLHDLYGNVAEWCLDHYQKDFYGTFPRDRLSVSPVKLPTTARFPHVLRGGSWVDSAEQCRSAARLGSEARWNRIDPDRPPNLWRLWNADFIGFRLVRAVEEQDDLKGIRSKVTKKSE